GNIGCDHLRFQGNQTVSGNGAVTINAASARVLGGTLTIGPGVTVTNAAGATGSLNIDPTGAIVNQGSLVSASGTLVLSGTGTLTNSPGGTIGAQTGGTFTLTNVNWSNAGTILVNAATVNLGGTSSALGTVSRTGGMLNLSAVFSGPTLAATAATGDINLSNGAGFNGTLLSTAGGAVFTSNGNVTLNAVTLAASIQLGNASCGMITVTGGLTFAPGGSITTGNIGCEQLRFQGTQSVDGPGTISIAAASVGLGGGTVTFGPQMLITNAAGTNGSININAAALVNNGTIRATGSILALAGNGTLTNNPGGTLLTQAGGTLTISQLNWSNGGTLNINAGTANLAGTTTQLGAITRTGGTLILSGTYNNPALALTAATGNIELGGSFVANGTTITATGGAALSFNGNPTFNGVTLGAPLSGTNASCGVLTVTGGLTFAAGGSLTTGNIGCEHVRFQGTQAIGGTGTITINSASISVFSGTATFGPGVTITNAPGVTGSIVINNSTLINQGILRATAVGLTVSGQGTAFITNAPGGTMGAQSGGTFAINNATWANNGTLLVNNATVNLAGTGNALGTVSRTGGTLTLSGSYTGATLALDGSTGSVTLSNGFAITGTTLTASGGAEFIVAGNASFTGVTLGAALSLSNASCGILTVTGGLTFAPGGSITTGNIGCEHLRFQGTQTVGGAGSIILNAASIGITGGAVTFGPGVTVTNAASSNAAISLGDNAQLINQGLIRVTGAARTLNLSASTTPAAGTFTNQGTLESRDGADFAANINLSNTGVIRVGTAGTFTVPQPRTLTNAAGGTLEVQGTGPNTTSDFGRIRIGGTLLAGGTLSVTYPNGLVPGCRIAVPIITTQGTGAISGFFTTRQGPPKPAPFASFFAVTATGATFSSTNQADVGSVGGVAQPDGILDNNDFVVFIDLFFAMNPVADRGSTGGLPGADGQWNNNDFVVYIDQFFAGCG
ncbi:MAG TPA: GC-type dockerin domain-anchored protein, partial [Phycisphaerales bacterium]|nr:GC-type dockerin domain-anchored protein [Phycisphaerales bacterium]